MLNATPPPSPSLPYSTTTTATVGSSKDHSKTTIYVILATSFFSLLFIFSLPSTSTSSSLSPRPDPFLFPTRSTVTAKIPALPTPPSIAYLISGSSGDYARILRLLFATYHPRNHYLLHLDRSAPQSDRDRLAITVQSVAVFQAAKNVDVIGKADFSYRKGSSPISARLHGSSLLLRLSSKWDWMINLNAGDYPLVTQDDLLHILSYLPKDLNFVNHTSYIGWRESTKLKPIIVDPGLYISEMTDMFYSSQKRELPNAFKLFSGPSFSILSRSFIEFCILGTDNFPRTLLMYLANTPSSVSNYFPTILCNSRQFNKTVINHNLQYSTFNESAKQKPNHHHQRLNPEEVDAMFQSGAAFATRLSNDDPVLDRIDREILRRERGEVVAGGWCVGKPSNGTCSVWGDADVLRPGLGARRLEKSIVEFLSSGWVQSHQCIVE